MTKKLSNKKRIVSKMNNIKSLKNIGNTKNKKMSSNSRKARLVGGRRVKGKKSKYMKKRYAKKKGGVWTGTGEGGSLTNERVQLYENIARMIIEYLINKQSKVEYPYDEVKLLKQLEGNDPKAIQLRAAIERNKIEHILPLLTVEHFIEKQTNTFSDDDKFYNSKCLTFVETIIFNLNNIYTLNGVKKAQIKKYIIQYLQFYGFCNDLSSKSPVELANLYFTKYNEEFTNPNNNMFVLSCHGKFYDNTLIGNNSEETLLDKMTIFSHVRLANENYTREQMFNKENGIDYPIRVWENFFENQITARAVTVSTSEIIEHTTEIYNYNFSWKEDEESGIGNCIYKNGNKILLNTLFHDVNEERGYKRIDLKILLSKLKEITEGKHYFLWLHTCLTTNPETAKPAAKMRKPSSSAQNKAQKALNKLDTNVIIPFTKVRLIKPLSQKARGASKVPARGKKT
jgi:hypothetical protein